MNKNFIMQQQERGQQLMFLAPTGNVHKAPSVHSGSEAGGSFVSDSDDDDGVFSPMPVMSPLLAVCMYGTTVMLLPFMSSAPSLCAAAK
jgi:hypothetical protein